MYERVLENFLKLGWCHEGKSSAGSESKELKAKERGKKKKKANRPVKKKHEEAKSRKGNLVSVSSPLGFSWPRGGEAVLCQRTQNSREFPAAPPSRGATSWKSAVPKIKKGEAREHREAAWVQNAARLSFQERGWWRDSHLLPRQPRVCNTPASGVPGRGTARALGARLFVQPQTRSVAFA